MVLASVALTINQVVPKAIEIWKQTLVMRAEGKLDKDQIVEWRKSQLRQLIEEALDETVENPLSRAEVSEALRKVASTFEKL